MSRNHWLIQRPLVTIVACGIHWQSIREACPFALLFVSPHFQPRPTMWVCQQLLLKGHSYPLCESDGGSCGATFHALPLPSLLPCPAVLPPSLLPHWGLVRWGGPSGATVGLRSTGCCGFEVWNCLEGVPCPCWQLPSSPREEHQLFFVKVNLLPVNTGNVVHMCSGCV